MPLIITATDFSDVAENAVNYACRLALEHGAQVVALHSFILPVMFSDVPMPASLINDAQGDSETQMGKLLADLAIQYPGLPLSGKVIYGDTIDALEEYKNGNNNPWMVVVGNSSLANNNTWPDSVLIDAFKTLKYPVLAVPPGATFTPPRRLCFAMDSKHEGYEPAVRQLFDIALQLNAELHVLNAQAPGSHDEHAIDEPARELLSSLKPEYHFIYEAANVDDAILAFVENNNMDWLVVMPRKHSFFEALMHKSHTRSLAHHSHIPILAIHESHK